MIYETGTRIPTPELSFEIRRQTLCPLRITARGQRPHTVIEVGSALDISSYEVQQLIGKIIVNITRRFAPEILLPRAKELAERLDTRPTLWRISSGRRILGSCTGSGTVTLSCVCVFLPLHLRDYIVCHELAHLHEMNHSAAFHSICNKFCDGHEKELIAEIKRFRFPLPKKSKFH